MHPFMYFKTGYTCTFACVGLAILATQAARADGTWTGGSSGGGSNGNWSTTANWQGGTVPGATSGTANTDTAIFTNPIANTWGSTAANPIVIDSTSQNIGALDFTGGAGNYFIGGSGGNPGGNSLLLSGGGSVQIDQFLSSTNAVETINAPIALEGSGGALVNNSANGTGTGAGTLNVGGAITGVTGNAILTLDGSNTNNNTIGGVISNGSATSLSVVKQGSGTWVLSGVNTYTGNTSVNSGALTIAAPSGAILGNNGGPATSNTTSTIASGASLTYNATGGSFRQAGINFAGTGTLNIVGGANTVTFGSNGGNGTVGGPGAINWGFGAGAVINIASGELIGGFGNADNWSSNQASLNVAAGATFQGSEAGGNGEPPVQFDALTGGGTIEGGFSNNPVYTIGVANGSGTFSGVIENQSQAGFSGGRLGIDKVGTGTQTLAGASTYTERTFVNGGTLSVTGSLANNNVDYDGGHNYSVTVNNTGTLIGTGTVGSTIVNSGGNLAPGVQPTVPFTGTPGTLVGGNLTLNNAGVLSPNVLDVVSSASLNVPALTFAIGANSASSKILVTGTGPADSMNFNDGNTGVNTSIVSINDLVGSSLTSYIAYVLIQGDASTIFRDNGSAWSLAGGTGLTAFGGPISNLGSDTLYQITGGLSLLQGNGTYFSQMSPQSILIYDATTHSIDLDVIPEPSTWALMLGGMTLLVFWQQRRNCRMS